MKSAPRTVRNWHPDRVDKLRKLALTKTKQQAADEMGCSYHVIKHAAKVYGVKFGHGVKGRCANITEENLEESDKPLIFALWRDGMEESVIAGKFEVYTSTIKKVIKEMIN